jgi:type II secretory pathway predicted ATPase ExeA/outer membrane protein OmpA-like peptidoglycan-associated protein
VFTDFYGLTLDPFRLNPDPRFCYRHRNFSKAKAYMQYVLMQGEGFVMVTGQPGTGKTMLIQDLLADPSVDLVRRAHITSTQVGAEDLLRLVASAFGIDPRSSSKASILLNLRAVLLQQLQTGHNSLVIVDEAQNLPFESIEELRMITNLQQGSRPLVQVFLIGQDSLRSLVREPRMEQLRQRILAACRMEPLSPEETQAYLRYRLSCAGWTGRPALTGAAVWQLHQASRGIPRLINAIAERLLLYGALEEKLRLDAEDALLIIEELRGEVAIGADRAEDTPPLGQTAAQPQADVGHLAVEMPREQESGPSVRPGGAQDAQEGISTLPAGRSQDGSGDAQVAVATPEQETVRRDGASSPRTEAVSASADRGASQGDWLRPPGAVDDPERPPTPTPQQADEMACEDRPLERMPARDEPPSGSPMDEGFPKADTGPPAPSTARWAFPRFTQEDQTAHFPGLLVDGDHNLPGWQAAYGPGNGRIEIPSEWRDTAAAAASRLWKLGRAIGVAAIIGVLLGSLVSVLLIFGPPWTRPTVSDGHSEPVRAEAPASRQEKPQAAPEVDPVGPGKRPTPQASSPLSQPREGLPRRDTQAGAREGGAAPVQAPAPSPISPAEPPLESTVSSGTGAAADRAPDLPGQSSSSASSDHLHDEPNAATEQRSEPQRPPSLDTAAAEEPAASPAANAPAAEDGSDHASPPNAGSPTPSGEAKDVTPSPEIASPQPTESAEASSKPPVSAAQRAPTHPANTEGAQRLAPLEQRLEGLGFHPKRLKSGALKLILHKEAAFATDSVSLPAGDRELLERLSRALAASGRIRVRVVGYTDDYGAADYNAQLSLKRARVVAAVLTQGGVPADRIVSEGRGEEDPLATGRVDGIPARDINRRIELIVQESPDR